MDPVARRIGQARDCGGRPLPLPQALKVENQLKLRPEPPERRHCRQSWSCVQGSCWPCPIVEPKHSNLSIPTQFCTLYSLHLTCLTCGGVLARPAFAFRLDSFIATFRAWAMPQT